MSRFLFFIAYALQVLRETDAPGFDETFHAKWNLSRDSKDYFMLESDLPYEEKKPDVFRRFDPDTRGDDDRTHELQGRPTDSRDHP